MENYLKDLKKSLDRVSECVVITDKNDNVVYVNNNLAKHNKWAKKDLLENSIFSSGRKYDFNFIKPYYNDAKSSLR